MIGKRARPAVRALTCGIVTLMAWSCSDPVLPPRAQTRPFAERGLEPPSLANRAGISLVRRTMLTPECRLSVILESASGTVRLAPEQASGGAQPSNGSEVSTTLTAAERSRLFELARAANLFVGGHLGVDASANDAPFERLEVRGDTNVIAILVTSGNPTFAADGPRRELLTTLHRLWEADERLGRSPCR